MEKQETIGFVELMLRILNSDLKHFKLCSAIVIIPTIVAFVLVMWVIEPTYRATAIVTPPNNDQGGLGGGIGNFLGKGKSGGGSGSKGGLSGSMGALFNLSPGIDDADVVWTIFNSWELHSQVIEHFDLATHYEFKGNFKADLLKEFRSNFEFEANNEDMFEISVEDKDFRLAAAIIQFMLDKGDSAFNAYKTSQARQSRQYFQLRLDSCEHKLDSLQKKFAKFQADHNFYNPSMQMESTIKYLNQLQAMREDLSMEMAYEKDDRGENSQRYDQLSKRYKGVNSALNETLDGKNKGAGMVALKQSPELTATYLQYESEINIQVALYQMLRVQSEELQIEEAKMLTNLHILEPPWENDKKVAPRRGLILMFVVFVTFLFATALCNFLTFIEEENKKGSLVADEWYKLCKTLHLCK